MQSLAHNFENNQENDGNLYDPIDDIIKEFGEIQADDADVVSTRVLLSGHLLIIGESYDGLTVFSGDTARDKIVAFSESSARRMRKYLRESVSEYRVFITLTYPAGQDYSGQKAKRDLRVFMQRYKRIADKSGSGKGFSAFWFMEFQRRGAIHFHIFGTSRIDKELLSQTWFDIVGSDDERHLRAGTNVCTIRSGKHGICSYASKYAAKHTQKTPPEEFGWVGRFWGVSGVRDTVSADTKIPRIMLENPVIAARYEKMAAFIQKGVKDGDMYQIDTSGSNVLIYYIKSKSLISSMACQISLMNVDLLEQNCNIYLERNPELIEDLINGH